MSGIVSGVKDVFFGGAQEDAAKAQERAYEESQRIIQENIAQARSDIGEIFPIAREDALSGFQSALDVFGQSIPQQANIFQSGNVSAQNALLSGLPQMQNAILGLPVDYSALQATQLDTPDMSYLQQELPQIQADKERAALAAQQAVDTPQQSPIPFPSFPGLFGTEFNFNSGRFSSPTGSSSTTPFEDIILQRRF